MVVDFYKPPEKEKGDMNPIRQKKTSVFPNIGKRFLGRGFSLEKKKKKKGKRNKLKGLKAETFRKKIQKVRFKQLNSHHPIFSPLHPIPFHGLLKFPNSLRARKLPRLNPPRQSNTLPQNLPNPVQHLPFVLLLPEIITPSKAAARDVITLA
ncbi:hypothetical protein BC829DRAFT_135479 [Chytridium lagenaria]|nr:hypothetical protein BC829DRAFT_135479 [Chytridium lagenaria]